MHVTFVKKILSNGEPCRKCRDVEQRLVEAGEMAHVDDVVVADERDPESAGMLLAARHGVHAAPFFVVEDGERTTVYTVYLRFSREVFGRGRGGRSAGTTSSVALARKDQSAVEAQELLAANPDLDLL